MASETFAVQEMDNGTSYRVLDPLGFPVAKANEFLENLEIRGRSPYTLHSYAVGLTDFLGWLRQANIAVDDVTRHVAGQYIADFGNGPKRGFAGSTRAGSKRQPRTVNHRLSVLASYFAFRNRQDDEAGTGPWFQRPNPISTTITGRRHGMTGRDAPVRGRTSEFRRRVPRRIPTQIDPTTALKLIEAAHSWRDKSILTLLFRTGQRIGDWKDGTGGHGILGMTLADIDQSRSMITVRLKGARDEHRVPVTEDFWPMFRRYLAEERTTGGDSTALWVGLRRGSGEPLTYAAFESSLRYISRKTGVRVHAHMFRHLLAQTVLEVTGNLKAAQDLLGHAQISTTADLYMHADQAAMVNAVAAVKFSFDKGIPVDTEPRATPLKYAFPYDTTTIEELDKAAASSLLLTGESS
ncbi:MAG: tyrosine-type recombinase/integrase [Acidobacteriota bacterium]|nr:tyrosine-type recombinase/integrase [Acidobacteriota bacterium]